MTENRFTGDGSGKPACFLLLGRHVRQVWQHDVVLQGERDARGGGARAIDLVDDDRVVAEVLDAGAAVGFGNRETEQPLLTRVGEQCRVEAAFTFPLLVPRDDPLAHEAADTVPELVVLGLEFDGHDGVLYELRVWGARALGTTNAPLSNSRRAVSVAL